jgi:hypothetical protein
VPSLSRFGEQATVIDEATYDFSQFWRNSFRGNELGAMGSFARAPFFQSKPILTDSHKINVL